MTDTAATELAALEQRLHAVRRAAAALEATMDDEFDTLGADERTSAANLMHYLAVRQFDLREDQRILARLGLSSLGRAEAHVMATLDAVLARLRGDLSIEDVGPDGSAGPTPDRGAALLTDRSLAALGPEPEHHRSRLMVTLPSEAADRSDLVDELVRGGMAIARINGAHDGPDRWQAMVRAVRAAAKRHGRTVRIAFDLPGPKIRVGAMRPGPEVVRVRPRRDAFGAVVASARVVLHCGDEDARLHADEHATPVPVSEVILAGAEVGDVVELTDTRGRRRRMPITAVQPGVVVCESDRTAYLASRLPLRRVGADGTVVVGEVGVLGAIPASIAVAAGDQLELVRGDGPPEGAPGVDAATSAVAARPTGPASIHVPEPAVFSGMRVGHRILIDDGEVEAIVTHVDADAGRASTEVIRPAHARIRPGKGINLPDSHPQIDAMTEADRAALAIVARDVDLVAMSYVSTPDDIDRLHAALDDLDAGDVGVILKIEHRRAFEALPRLLIRALRRPPVAVMVARGDLAVEVGFERLAEVQEEILWLCEAAHVPVIWATQVLETLAKRGSPTRAEVTDAAWASRAECVMLNKGPHIVDTLRFLDDVLARMQQHQDKRTPMLRRLSVAEALDR